MLICEYRKHHENNSDLYLKTLGIATTDENTLRYERSSAEVCIPSAAHQQPKHSLQISWYHWQQISSDIRPSSSLCTPSMAPYSAMISSRIPLELCEHIIDACYVQRSGFRYRPDLPVVLYSTWLSTALVCSHWLPRTRFNLYHHVVIDCDHDILPTLSRSPHLARLVIQLDVLSYKHELCTSYARLLDPRLLANCVRVSLHIVNFPDVSRRYANIIFYPFRTSPLTRLDVQIDQRSCSSVILLLYTLPLLRTLCLRSYKSKYAPHIIPDSVMHMLHKRRCPFIQLTYLMIEVCPTFEITVGAEADICGRSVHVPAFPFRRSCLGHP